MEDQTLQPEVPTREEALSWQFILVLVVIAALIPLLASSFIANVDRAEAPPIPTATPQPLSAEALQAMADLPLDRIHIDPAGITVQYPESWYALSLGPGFFVLSNYELDLTSTEFPPDIVLVQVQSGQLNTFTLPDGSVPDPGTSPQSIMEALVADAAEPLDVTSRTIGDLPAASITMLGTGSGRELVMITPTDTDLILVDSSAEATVWSSVEPLVTRIVDTITFTPTGN